MYANMYVVLGGRRGGGSTGGYRRSVKKQLEQEARAPKHTPLQGVLQ